MGVSTGMVCAPARMGTTRQAGWLGVRVALHAAVDGQKL
jgi:hypothetical protein